MSQFNSQISLPKLAPSKEERAALELQEKNLATHYSDEAVAKRVAKLEAEGAELRALRNQTPVNEAVATVAQRQADQEKLTKLTEQLERKRAE